MRRNGSATKEAGAWRVGDKVRPVKGRVARGKENLF